MNYKGYAILILSILTLFACRSNRKYEVLIYQGFYFKEGQRFKLVIDNGLYSKSRFFKRTYQSGEFKRLKTYRTDRDSIKVYFKLDDKDTVFTMASDYTTRLVVGSSARGKMQVGTDNEADFWETQ